MKRFLMPALLAGVLFTSACDNKQKEAAPEGKPESLEDRVSYYIGQDIAKNMKQQNFAVSSEWVELGMRDVMDNDSATLMTEEELSQVMGDFQTFMQEQQTKKADSALQKGRDFLESNRTKEGVKVTASGLQYQVLETGSGKAVDSSSFVKVHYHGTTVDGKVFDSSIDRGQPTSFPVAGVIPGWTEALLMMKEGAKYKLFVPSELAYGAQGAGQSIGPNEVLIFDVELLEVMDEQPQMGQPSR